MKNEKEPKETKVKKIIKKKYIKPEVKGYGPSYPPQWAGGKWPYPSGGS